MMSFYPLPKGVKKRMDYFGGRLLWGEDQGIEKYHLIRWSVFCSPKENGGLGVKDLGCMNIALLCKWIRKLEMTQGLWRGVLYNIYLKNKTMSGVRINNGDAWFWRGLLKVRDIFYALCTRKIGNGKRTRFCEDHWIGFDSFEASFKNLYDICETKGVTLHMVLSTGLHILKFHRTLTDNVLQRFPHLQHLLGGWLKKFRKKDKHMVSVGIAAILWAIWKMRNNACFRKIRPNDSLVVTNQIGRLILDWANLQVKDESQNALSWGAKFFVRLSSEAFRAAQGWRPEVQRLTR
jgi:hypothetical protein